MITAIVIFFILSILAGAYIVISSSKYERVISTIMSLVFIALSNIVFIFAVCPLFGGIGPNYSVGQAKSIYLADYSYNSFYKSYEVTEFVGEDSKNYKSVRMSTRDKDIGRVLEENLNKRVDIKYRQWALQPHFYSESPNILTEVKQSLAE